MPKPILTKQRVAIAYTVAILADLIEFPITAAEVTVIAAPAAEGLAIVVDAVAFGIITKLLGFHWMLLPSFCVEVIPGIDMLPTWVGCVWFVVRQRRKEGNLDPAPAPKSIEDKDKDVIDV
jgi:hypothetical protein